MVYSRYIDIINIFHQCWLCVRCFALIALIVEIRKERINSEHTINEFIELKNQSIGKRVSSSPFHWCLMLNFH